MDGLASFYRECQPPGHRLRFNEKNDEVVIIQLRRSVASNEVKLEKFRLRGPEIAAWISDDTNSTSGGGVVLQLLQLAEVSNSAAGYKYLDVSEQNFHATIQKFGLRDVLDQVLSDSEMFRSGSDGSQGDLRTWSAIHVNEYFTMLHRFDHQAKLTQGVSWTNNDNLKVYLERALWNFKTSSNEPLYFSLCMATAIDFGTSLALTAMHQDVASIEFTTGYQMWYVTHYKPTNESLDRLSKRAVGNSSVLAAHKRSNEFVADILRSCDAYTSQVSDVKRATDTSNETTACLSSLWQRNGSQRIYLGWLTTRVQNQQTALLHMIAQRNTDISIAIAEATKRDSSSMKALAAVTVLFLPAMFMSSLFSTSMFDWQTAGASLVLNNKFWIYWAVSLPLTVFTIGAWVLWMRIASSRRDREAEILREPKDDVEQAVSRHYMHWVSYEGLETK